MTEPTWIGKEKYDSSDGYYEGVPCTCNEDCPEACKGQDCQCEACHNCYMDFLGNDSGCY